MHIPFNRPALVGTELSYVQQAMASGQLAGNGEFSRRCERWFEQRFGTHKALLTPSCTAALEMAAILLDIQPDDEVIMPSYTFVSTANAFVLRGAKIVFVDVRPDTMNIDERLIEQAITPKTKAIVPVHYGGVACEMATIMALAAKYRLWVVEDAAQAVMARYRSKPLGTIGHLGCYSFHETKNYTASGEGGAILINDPQLVARAEIVREKGTDRSRFFRGLVDKYRWQDVGSSFLLSDLQAAYLYAQLETADLINQRRLTIWQRYFQAFSPLAETGELELAAPPADCEHNAHLFYLKLADQTQREAFIQHLKRADILSVFHYVPLHTSPAGQRFGRFNGEDRYTTAESDRLVRLPLFFNLTEQEAERVMKTAMAFFK